MATDENERGSSGGEHHPAVEEFISGDPDELPELGEPPGEKDDPFIHGGRLGAESNEK